MAGRAWRALAWLTTSPARYVVVAGWAVAVILAYLYLPSLSQTPSSSASLLFSQHAPAIETERRAVSDFGFPLLAQLAIVQYNTKGLSITTQARVIEHAAQIDLGREPAYPQIRAALPVLNTAGLFPSSRERGTTAITYLVTDPSLSLSGETSAAQRYVRQRVN